MHGWDFVGDDRGHPRHDNDPADPLGHGTHVAGIVGAVGNNGEGVVGVNWNVSLLPLKIADQHGMISTAAAVEADVCANRVRNVDAERLLQLPRARFERIGAAG